MAGTIQRLLRPGNDAAGPGTGRRGLRSPCVGRDVPPVPDYRREDAVFRTIIVPVDGSDHARKAVEIASRLAEPDGGRIVLILSLIHI